MIYEIRGYKGDKENVFFPNSSNGVPASFSMIANPLLPITCRPAGDVNNSDFDCASTIKRH